MAKTKCISKPKCEPGNTACGFTYISESKK